MILGEEKNNRRKLNKINPEDTMVSLFIILFYISSIKTYRLLAVTGILVIIYSVITCEDKFFIRLTKPVIPFVILMILPIIIRLIVYRSLEDIDFTMIIVCKVLISSILLGTIVSKHSALYMVDGILNIGLPQILNRILALTFRYFHMIDEDIKKGNKALISRGINERKGLSSLSIFGEWIGGFFLKSSNHSDMVFNAMKSRGFQGEARNNKFNNKELILKSSMLALFLLAILVIDRTV